MSVKKNVVYSIILNVSNVIFPVITTPYISRVLGVQNVGIVNFATTYASYFVLFAALGIPVYGIREIAKYNDDEVGRHRIFTELFLLTCITTFVFLISYLVTIFCIPAFREEREFLLVAGILLFFVPFNTDWFFSGRENFKLVTIRSLVAKTIAFIGLFFIVKTRDDMIPYLVLTVGATVFSQLWNFWYMFRREVKFHYADLQIGRHMKPVLVLFAANVAVSIYTMLNPIMLGFLSDYIQVGYYTSVTKISMMVVPIVTSMSTVIIARINTIKGSGQEGIKELLNRSFSFMIILSVPATIGLIAISPRFVPFFFGREIIPATTSLQMLSLLILIIGINNFFGRQILVGMGYEKKFLITVSIGAVTSLCFNLLLIGPYGSFGSSIASVVAELIITIVVIVFAVKIIRIRINTRNLFQSIISAIPIWIISVVLNNMIESDFGYLSGTLILSGSLYMILMIYVFRNEVACQILYSFMHKFIKR